MYDVNSVLITLVLLAAMTLAIELGYRLGCHRSGAHDGFKSHVNTIAASLVGILALLLGFTFSLSLHRFDSRSEVVVDEANAIGTAYLRAELLPASVRDGARQRLREYLDLRVRAGAVTLVEDAERAALLASAVRAQEALWALARQASEENPHPATTGLFVQALNELIDTYGRRCATLDRHVPELVLLLLFGTFLMAGLIVGYAAGVAGHRASFATYVLVVLIAILVFIILDLDRPRRGLIQVSQESLVELQAAIREGAGAGDRPLPAGTEGRSTR